MLNNDVKAQLNRVENLYNQEKNMSKDLHRRLEEINKANKEVLLE